MCDARLGLEGWSLERGYGDITSPKVISPCYAVETANLSASAGTRIEGACSGAGCEVSRRDAQRLDFDDREVSRESSRSRFEHSGSGARRGSGRRQGRGIEEGCTGGAESVPQFSLLLRLWKEVQTLLRSLSAGWITTSQLTPTSFLQGLDFYGNRAGFCSPSYTLCAHTGGGFPTQPVDL